MEFFEGKRVRELRTTFEDALDQTLEPQTMEVRRRPPPPPAGRSEKCAAGERGERTAHPRVARPSAPSPDPSSPRVFPSPSGVLPQR